MKVPLLPVSRLGGDSSIALDMNNQGQVVGQAQLATPGYAHAFIWSRHTGMVDLGGLISPTAYSAAVSINDRSQVIGAAEILREGDYHNILWSAQDGMIDLDVLTNNALLSAKAINNRGQIAGERHIRLGEYSATHAALLTPSR